MDSSLEFIYMCTLAEISPARPSEIKDRIQLRLKISNQKAFEDSFDRVHVKLRKSGTIISVKKGVYVLKYDDHLYLGLKVRRINLNNARMFYLKKHLRKK